MWAKSWIPTLTVISLVSLVITAPIARGESKNMNSEDHISSNEQKTIGQTEREVLDYWTPERMRNAKPLMLTVPDSPTAPLHIEEPSGPSISAPGSDVEYKEYTGCNHNDVS